MRARALLCNAYALMRVRVRTCTREDNWSDLSKKKKEKNEAKQKRWKKNRRCRFSNDYATIEKARRKIR